jgi:sugar phosphate isomerase/epimerase
MNRLSINQYSVRQLTLVELVEECRETGIGVLGLWRDKVSSAGSDRARQLLRDADISVSSLCRGGFFPYSTDEELVRTTADNRKAVDEAAEIGSPLLVLVCGGIAAAGLERSREMVLEGIANLAPYARDHGVKLGIEPLHPMFAADRSVISTLEQANDLADHFSPDTVGVIVDTYHVWWDPNVYREIQRAGDRILGFHMSDWLAPPPHFLNGRGLMGDGFVEFKQIAAAVNRAGYAGPIEVEIFNEGLWALPGPQALALIKSRFQAVLA